MSEALVFCTSNIDFNPIAYQNWVDYYTDFFNGINVNLLMINDGANNKTINLKEVEQVVLEPHLGKEDNWIMPGKKRSFYYGLIHSMKYSRVAQIESNFYIHESGKEEFLKYLFSDGYYTGYSNSDKLPESSLQIINEKWILNYLIDRYCCYDNWYESINFEKMLMMVLRPNYILNGGKKEEFNKDFNFVTNCTYKEFLEMYEKT